MHHGTIVIAPRDGQQALARAAAKEHLCNRGGCGECRICRLIDAGDHPDAILIAPDGASIKIGQVRSLIKELSIRPYMGERRFVAFLAADLMTEQAQNALLKTIEEPGEGCSFLLLCESVDRLLPTIRSRCILKRGKTTVIDHAPLAARLMARDEGESARWQKDLTEKGPLYTAWEDGKKALGLGFSKKYSMMEETLAESKAAADVLLYSMSAMLSHMLLARTGAAEPDPELGELMHSYGGDGYTLARLMEIIETAGRMSTAHVVRRSTMAWLALSFMEEIDENRSGSKV